MGRLLPVYNRQTALSIPNTCASGEKKETQGKGKKFKWMHCYQLCITLATLPYFISLVAYFRGKTIPPLCWHSILLAFYWILIHSLGFYFIYPTKPSRNVAFCLYHFYLTLANFFPVTNIGNTSPTSAEVLLFRGQGKNPKQGENKAKPTCTEKLRQLFGMPALLFHSFYGASQCNEICRKQNWRLLKRKL